MTPEEYVKNALNTEPEDYGPALGRLMMVTPEAVRLLHGAMGVSTEAGEMMDQIKKHLIYGKNLDVVNLKEEMGDLFWYCAIIADAAGFSFEEVFETNIAKLAKRYPERFSEDSALNRDLPGEREQLEP